MLDGMGTLAENRDIIAAAEANKRLALQRDRIIRNIWQAIAGAVSFVVIWWLDVHVNDGMMFGADASGVMKATAVLYVFAAVVWVGAAAYAIRRAARTIRVLRRRMSSNGWAETVELSGIPARMVAR